MIRTITLSLALIASTQVSLAGTYENHVMVCTNRCIDEHGHSGEAQAYQCKKQCEEQAEEEGN
jgi:hypothetical protein